MYANKGLFVCVQRVNLRSHYNQAANQYLELTKSTVLNKDTH